MRKRRTKSLQFVYTVPSRKAKVTAGERIRWRARRATLQEDLDVVLRRVNRFLQGWANYFRHGVSKAMFSQLDLHAWRRIGAWICRKHGRMSSPGGRYATNSVTGVGGSPTTGSSAAARPASRSPSTATAVLGSRPPGPLSSQPLDNTMRATRGEPDAVKVALQG